MCEKKRTIESIGREQYNFDFQKEKAIYSHLYGICGTKKKWRNLCGEQKVYYYREWKQYVQKRYIDYDMETLREFSGYLNQRLRNVRPTKEYWNLCIAVLLSVWIGRFPEIIEDVQKMDLSGGSVLGILFEIITIGVLIVPSVYFTYHIAAPIWDNNTHENLLADYKEIIDKMIEDREFRLEKKRRKGKRIKKKVLR